MREADGSILTGQELNAAAEELADFAVPTEDGAIRQLGISQAFEGETTLEYDEAADTITDVEPARSTPSSSKATGSSTSARRPATRCRTSVWTANVGLLNCELFTDSRIRSDFVRIFLWTLVFDALGRHDLSGWPWPRR